MSGSGILCPRLCVYARMCVCEREREREEKMEAFYPFCNTVSLSGYKGAQHLCFLRYSYSYSLRLIRSEVTTLEPYNKESQGTEEI